MATEHADELNDLVRVKRERIDTANEHAIAALTAKTMAERIAMVTSELRDAQQLMIECVICLVNKPNMLYECSCIVTCDTCPSSFRDNACPKCRRKFKSNRVKPRRIHI